MGTSKRYAAHYDRIMGEKILESIARDLTPDTLTAEEIDLEHEDRTTPPVARPVRAWVRYGPHAFRVDAEVVAWTSRAAAIRWRVSDARVDRAWVWSSAVEARRT